MLCCRVPAPGTCASRTDAHLSVADRRPHRAGLAGPRTGRRRRRRDLQRAAEPARRRHSAPRRAGHDRRPARRAGLARRGAPHGLLAVRPVGRPSRRGRHDRPGLVLAHGHLLRHPSAGGARHGARDARRPRPDRRRRQRADLPGHLQRRAAGVPVRGQPARRAGRRRARRDGRAERARVQRAGERARGGGSEPGLRVRVEGAAHRFRLRGRDPDPLQEPALPVARPAGLEPARDPRRAEHRARGQLGAGAAQRGVVPGAGRAAAGPHGPASRPGAGPEPGRHGQGRRRSRGLGGLAVRREPSGVRRQRALGPHEQPHAQRHGQPRLLAGRVRRGAVPVRPAAGALLPREAAVLPRRPRAVHDAQQPDLHPPHRRADRGGEAHGQGFGHERGVPGGRRRCRDVGLGPRSPGLQRPARAARRGRAVEGGLGLHRSRGRRQLEPRGRRRRAAHLRRDLRLEPPGGLEPHGPAGGHDHGAHLAGDARPDGAALRLPLLAARRGRRLPRRGRLHQPPGHRRRERHEPGNRLRRGGLLHGAVDGRRRARRHVAVPGLRAPPAVAGQQAALQQQLHVPRRVAGGPVGPHRDLRLRPRAVRRLRAAEVRPGRRRDPAVRGPVAAAEPRLRDLARHAAPPWVLGQHLLALGAGREFLRVGVVRHPLPPALGGVAADREAAGGRQLPAAVLRPAHGRIDGRPARHPAPEGRIPDDARDLLPHGEPVPIRSSRTTCATTPARSCPSSSATPPRASTRARWASRGTACGPTGCSPTSRRPAR